MRRRVVAGGEIVHFECKRRRKDGSLFDARVSTHPCGRISARTAPEIMASVIENVTEAKRVGDALRKSEHRREESLRWLRQVLEQSPISACSSSTAKINRSKRIRPRRSCSVDRSSGPYHYAQAVHTVDGQYASRARRPAEHEGAARRAHEPGGVPVPLGIWPAAPLDLVTLHIGERLRQGHVIAHRVAVAADDAAQLPHPAEPLVAGVPHQARVVRRVAAPGPARESPAPG